MSSPRKGALRRAEARQALGFVSPALLGLGLFTLFPVGLSIVMSLFNWPTFGARTFNGLGNYIKLFTVSPDFWPAMRNTFVFAITYVPINIALSLGLAVALNSRIRGRGALRVLFFIPVVTPMVANILVWKMLLQPKGALNGMSVWQGLGYNMLIFSAVLEQLPDSVIEAARIDGATGARLFFRVTLPMISPAVFFATVMTMIGSLQVFAQPQLLTGGGPGNSTQPIVQFIYNNGFRFQDLGLAAAAAWILFAVIIVLTALQFRAQKKWVHYEY